LLDNEGSLFENKLGPKFVKAESRPDRLYAKIEQLNMKLDWHKKVWDQPIKKRQGYLDQGAALALSTHCQLLKVTRSVLCEQKKMISERSRRK